jgi:hypothetical protein
MVSRALSYYADTVLHANELNRHPNIDNLLHFHYLLNSIKPYKRPFVKWSKKVKIADLDVVKEYYGYSTDKALMVLDLFNDEQLAVMREALEKG